MPVVGFIGLGNMGAHMARNLAKSGRKVVVYDVNSSVKQQFREEGIATAESPAEIGEAAKDIITMLPQGSHVESVFSGKKGLFETLQQGSLCVDCSTISPLLARDLAARIDAKQSAFLDAPVSGGTNGALNATLTFMVGGTAKNFARARPYLSEMGKNTIHCGEAGTGQATKICNNMLLSIHMIGVAEALNLGAKLGLDPKALSDVINTSTGRCWSSDTYNPCPGVMDGVPASRSYTGGFGNQLMAKDLGLAQEASTEVKAPTPLGSLAHQLYRILANNPEFSEKDFSSVYEFLQKQN